MALYRKCPACGGMLCEMDRAFFDNCTWCDHPIPKEMKLDEHSYFPDPCNLPGHVPGCAGKAGGEHELLITPQPIPDDARLEIGRLVFEKFLSGSPENGSREDATDWLEAIGFYRVEWIQGSQDDILLLALWRFLPREAMEGPDRMLDEFILEFSGYDAANIALFNLVKEVSM